MNAELLALARKTVELALRMGADEAAVGVGRSRYVSLEWRDGRVENAEESTTRGLSLKLYLDHKYSSHNTSDVRPAALERFVGDAVGMTRHLEPDPYRSLPDPELYADRPEVDLEIHDPGHDRLTPETRRELASSLEETARDVEGGAERIVSVTAGAYDVSGEGVRVHSNGFEGGRKSTSFWMWTEVSVRDEGEKRPEGWATGGARFIGDLPEVSQVGKLATRRALDCIGARPIASGRYPLLVENRAASRLIGMLVGSPLTAWALQQKRSFLEEMQGKQLGSDKLTIVDHPLLTKGFGSRHYDSEGISARRLPLFDGGVLKNYYVDTYYGKKLGMKPTTGSVSNLDWALGARDQAAMVADMPDGVLVTSFLGGNSNDTTGDFSMGIRGFYIHQGAIQHPVSEMNISGNQQDLWKRLAEVGSQPPCFSTTCS
jgi:PmbA protein